MGRQSAQTTIENFQAVIDGRFGSFWPWVVLENVDYLL
jgi:hypothetical protein